MQIVNSGFGHQSLTAATNRSGKVWARSTSVSPSSSGSHGMHRQEGHGNELGSLLRRRSCSRVDDLNIGRFNLPEVPICIWQNSHDDFGGKPSASPTIPT